MFFNVQLFFEFNNLKIKSGGLFFYLLIFFYLECNRQHENANIRLTVCIVIDINQGHLDTESFSCKDSTFFYVLHIILSIMYMVV